MSPQEKLDHLTERVRWCLNHIGYQPPEASANTVAVVNAVLNRALEVLEEEPSGFQAELLKQERGNPRRINPYDLSAIAQLRRKR